MINSVTFHSVVGTDCYLAPEIRDGRLVKRGKAADVWACGLVILEMMTLIPTWEYKFNFSIKAITEPEMIEEIFTEIKDKFDE